MRSRAEADEAKDAVEPERTADPAPGFGFGFGLARALDLAAAVWVAAVLALWLAMMVETRGGLARSWLGTGGAEAASAVEAENGNPPGR